MEMKKEERVFERISLLITTEEELEIMKHMFRYISVENIFAKELSKHIIYDEVAIKKVTNAIYNCLRDY